MLTNNNTQKLENALQKQHGESRDGNVQIAAKQPRSPLLQLSTSTRPTLRTYVPTYIRNPVRAHPAITLQHTSSCTQRTPSTTKRKAPIQVYKYLGFFFFAKKKQNSIPLLPIYSRHDYSKPSASPSSHPDLQGSVVLPHPPPPIFTKLILT